MSSHFTLSVLTKAEKNQAGSFVFPFSASTVTFLFFYVIMMKVKKSKSRIKIKQYKKANIYYYIKNGRNDINGN